MFSGLKLHDWLFLVALVLSLAGWIRAMYKYGQIVQKYHHFRQTADRANGVMLRIIGYILEKKTDALLSCLISMHTDGKTLSAGTISNIASMVCESEWLLTPLSVEETREAIAISKCLPASTSPKNLTIFLKEQFVQKLVAELRDSAEHSFASCMDSVKVIEDFRIGSTKWQEAHREMILLAAEYAEETTQVESLYEHLHVNSFRSLIYPILHHRVSQLIAEVIVS